MRNPFLLMAVVAVTVLSASGVAWAAAVDCGGDADRQCSGTAEDDAIDGSAGADTIFARGGDDTVHAMAGNDRVYGHSREDDAVPENDKLFGGDGADIVDGNDGDDEIYGGPGNDVGPFGSPALVGGKGDDAVHGGPGDDRIAGWGGGNDTLYGDAGADDLENFDDPEVTHDGEMHGGDGPDEVTGTVPVLTGGAGDDYVRFARPYEGDLAPPEEVREVSGGTGDDLLRLDADGRIDGGFGDDDFDRLYPSNSPGGSFESYGTGARTITGGPGNDSAKLMGDHDDTVYFDDGQRDVVVTCGPGADAVYFDQGLDTFKSNPDCEQRFPR